MTRWPASRRAAARDERCTLWVDHTSTKLGAVQVARAQRRRQAPEDARRVRRLPAAPLGAGLHQRRAALPGDHGHGLPRHTQVRARVRPALEVQDHHRPAAAITAYRPPGHGLVPPPPRQPRRRRTPAPAGLTAQARSKATSTASRCSSGRCMAEPTPTSCANASSSPTETGQRTKSVPEHYRESVDTGLLVELCRPENDPIRHHDGTVSVPTRGAGVSVRLLAPGTRGRIGPGQRFLLPTGQTRQGGCAIRYRHGCHLY